MTRLTPLHGTMVGRRAKRGLVAVLTVVLSLAAIVLGLEVLLRFLPVSDGLRGVPVDDQNPVYRFSPNRTLRWSKGWNFQLVNEIHTNNYGFISNWDYDPAAKSPLLAVIGDSFVEAAMVPFDRTAAGILGRSVEGRGRVYSFGSSGAALSQYLAYARYARDEFHPDGMVIIIVGNDFDESLMKYRQQPGFHYFVQQSDGRLALQRIDRSIPWWKDLFVMPTIGLYIVMNLEAGNVIERLKQWTVSLHGGDRRFVGNVDADPEPGRVKDSERAVDEFLARLPEMAGLPVGKILLVLDAPRPEIYAPDDLKAVQESYFEVMRRYLIGEASQSGYQVVDLEALLVADYQRRGLRFEYANDYHWNPTGHEIVARAIGRSPMFQALFGRAGAYPQPMVEERVETQTRPEYRSPDMP
jgi:hypothetical protein